MYLYHQIPPWPSGWSDDAKLVRQANSSYERNLAVDEQEFAMIAQEITESLSQLHGVVPQQLDTGVDQTASIGLHQAERSEAVEDEAHTDSAMGRTHKGLNE